MLNFIGRGSSFNTKEGNNSAYIKNGDHLLLIDCGSDVFSRIMKLNLLDDVKEIDVILTHMHPDHFGSLGDLIFYSYFAFSPAELPSLTVYHCCPDLSATLENMGVYSFMYHSIEMIPNMLAVKVGEYKVFPTKVPHYPSSRKSKEFVSIGFFLKSKYDTIYYSGDTNELNFLALKELEKGNISRIYQDVSSIDFKGNPHLSYNTLLSQISADLRHLIYCMHIDTKFNESAAKDDGFMVVQCAKIK